MALKDFQQFVEETDALDLTKQNASRIMQAFPFGRSEGLNDDGRWTVFVGENDPSALDATLRALGFEFYSFTDDDGITVSGYMDDYTDLTVRKASRIVAAGNLVGYEITLWSDTSDVDALDLGPDVSAEADSSDDGDSKDDSFTDINRHGI